MTGSVRDDTSTTGASRKKRLDGPRLGDSEAVRPGEELLGRRGSAWSGRHAQHRMHTCRCSHAALLRAGGRGRRSVGQPPWRGISWPAACRQRLAAARTGSSPIRQHEEFPRININANSCSRRWGPCPSPTPCLVCPFYLFIYAQRQSRSPIHMTDKAQETAFPERCVRVHTYTHEGASSGERRALCAARRPPSLAPRFHCL